MVRAGWMARPTTETSEDPAGEAPSGRGGWMVRPTTETSEDPAGEAGTGWGREDPAHHRDQRGPGR